MEPTPKIVSTGYAGKILKIRSQKQKKSIKYHFHKSLSQRSHQWGTQGKYYEIRVNFLKKSPFKISFSKNYPKDGINGDAQRRC